MLPGSGAEVGAFVDWSGGDRPMQIRPTAAQVELQRNGDPLRRAAFVEHGDVFALGDCHFVLVYPDELWADTVFEFLLAYHRAVMTREHVAQTLLPLYLGRTASFLQQHGSSGPAVVQDALESLGQAFELAKPQAAAQWKKA